MQTGYILPTWLILSWLATTAVLLLALVAVVIRHRHKTIAQYLEHKARTTELKSATDFLRQRCDEVSTTNHSLLAELNQLRERNFALQAQLLTAEALSKQKESALQAEIATLMDAKQSLSKEFESLAGRLFDAKQEQFSRATQMQLQQLMSPFREQLKDFRSKVEEVQQQDVARHHQMLSQIIELQKQSQQIGKDAVTLANALKSNNKVMGNWGEMVLTNILEQMGFERGRDFDLQVSQATAEGKRVQPDVVVYLPDEKDLIIDAKVSLLAYERFTSQTDEDHKAQAMRELVDSLRAHMRGLAGKNYAELVGRQRLDFVCMFVPVEGAFVTAVQQAPELLQEAYDKQILIVSPASLFVILRTVYALWQRDRQDKNVEQIVVSAGKLHDQFVRFLDSMQDVGTSLERADRSFKLAMNRLQDGNGNLIRRVDDLRRLGAKANKVIPREYVESGTAAHDRLEEQTND